MYSVMFYYATDIRVDWQVYNIEEGDPKLMDMVVCFGKAFPLKDAEDKEIVPPAEGNVDLLIVHVLPPYSDCYVSFLRKSDCIKFEWFPIILYHKASNFRVMYKLVCCWGVNV